MCRDRFIALMLVVLGFAGAAEAQTWVLGQPSTAAGTGITWYGATTSQWNMGYEFTCNVANVTVTHLGCAWPDTEAHPCALFNATTQALIAQVTTSTAATSGAWRSGALTTPVVLTQGQNYVVASLKSATQGYIGVNSSAPAAWHPTSGAITHIRDRWASSTTVTTFPASTSSQWHWGPADFAYTTGPGITVAATAGTSQNVYANSTGTGSNGISAGTFTLSANSSGAATLNSINITAQGTGNDSNAYSEVRLYEDTGGTAGVYDPGVDTPYGAAATVFPADNGTLTFTQSQNFSASQTRRYFIVVKLNGSTLATSGQTFNFQVGDISVAAPASKSGVPSGTMNGLTILSPAFTFTDNTSATQGTAYPSSGGYVMQDFTVAYPAGPDNALASITLTAQGSGNDSTAYASVALYFDTDSSGSYTGGDAQVATTAAFSADNGTATLTLTGSNSFTAGGPSRRYFVVVAFNTTPTATQTFQTRITAVSGSYTTTTGTNVPSPTGGFTAGYQIGQLSFTFADASPAAQANAYLGGSDFLLQSFTVNYAAGPNNTLGTITLTAAGSGNDLNDYASVRLYRDANSNTTYDIGVDALVDTVASFNADNGTLNFTLSGAEAQFTAAQTKRFYVVAAFNMNGANNTTFQSQVTAASAMGLGANAQGLPAPAAGPAPGLLLLANNLVFTLNGPGAATTVYNNAQGPNNEGLVLLDVTVNTISAAWTLNSITFRASGTGDDATAYSNIALYEDSNASGAYDGPSGGDALAVASAGTSFNANDGTYTATLSNGAFAASTTRRFFLVVRFGGTAVTGQTFNARVDSVTATPPSGGQTTGVPSSYTTSFIIDSPALTVAGAPGAPGAAVVEGGAAFAHSLGLLRLSATNNNVTVTGLTLTPGGTGDFATDLAAANGLELYLDNGNGTFDGAPTDSLLFSGPGVSSANVCNFTSSVTVNNGQSRDIWVRLNVLGTAGGSVPETFTAMIANTTDVAVVGSPAVLMGTPSPTTNSLSVVIFAVTGVTPVTGPQSGGTALTITGSGFLAPLTVTIGGVLCTGTPTISAGNTQITGLMTPAGAGNNLPIVVTSGSLTPKAAPVQFSYFGGSFIGGGAGGGGGGGGSGCDAKADGSPWAALLALLALSAAAFALARLRRA